MDDKEIVGTVVCDLRPYIELVYLRTEDGWQYVFYSDTPGLDLSTVKEGQTYRCIVTKLGIVKKAELL